MFRSNHFPSAFGFSVTRRGLLAAGLASAAVLPFGFSSARADRVVSFHTWLLSSPDQLRPADSPAPSQTEIDELLALRDERTALTSDLVEKWHTGPAVLPWTNLTLELIRTHKPSPVRVGRALALFHAAANDAVVAAQDARTAVQRPGPALIEPAIEPLVDASGTSFPSEHAAIAGAAGVVLPYLFPQDPEGSIANLVHEATISRLEAGANFRSDIEAGLAIGRAVGELAVQRGKSDGSDAEWDGSGRLTGEGYWEPTPPKFVEMPLDPLAGTWKTWVLPSGDALRPMPPPEFGSTGWEAELLAVQSAVANRTPEQEEAVNFWAGSPGTVTPAGLWIEIARDLILRDKLGTASAAHALALTSVAMYDAFVCCWDAKFTYWMARPITADPSLDVLIPTPPFPTYTSGHSTISAAAAAVLGHVFPGDAESVQEQANEAKNSRLWAGIHFPIDNEVGAAGGGQVGRLVVAVAGKV